MKKSKAPSNPSMPMTPEVLIPLIQASIGTVLQLITWVGNVTTSLKQNAEMTPAQEKELDDAISKLPSKPWWTPEKL